MQVGDLVSLRPSLHLVPVHTLLVAIRLHVAALDALAVCAVCLWAGELAVVVAGAFFVLFFRLVVVGVGAFFRVLLGLGVLIAEVLQEGPAALFNERADVVPDLSQ